MDHTKTDDETRTNIFADLSVSQRAAANKILDQWKLEPDQSQVFAIVGQRGMGKSTTLNKIADALKQKEEKCILLFPPAVDVGKTDEEEGILARVLRYWFQAVSTRIGLEEGVESYLTPSDAMTRRSFSQNKDFQQLKETFDDMYRLAITHNHSFTEIAREMAMSPDQYSHYILDWAKKKNTFPKKIEKLIDLSTRLLNQYERNRFPVRFVLILDDLDLAAPKEILRSWVKTFVNLLEFKELTWILTYDFNRLIPLLSEGTPGKKHELDLITGQSVLAKVFNDKRNSSEFELRDWSTDNLHDFVPLSKKSNFNQRGIRRNTKEATSKDDPSLNQSGDSKSPKTIRQLATQFFSNKLPTIYYLLLPRNPRGLKQIYEWLEMKITQDDNEMVLASSPTQNKSIHAYKEFIILLGKVNQLQKMDRYIEYYSHDNFPEAHNFMEKSELSDIDWQILIASAIQDKDLNLLPVKQEFKNLVANKRPEEFLEGFIDIQLTINQLPPASFLKGAHLIGAKLRHCTKTLPLAINFIINVHETYPLLASFSSHFVKWHERQEGTWRIEIGPDVILSSLAQHESKRPDDLIAFLMLDKFRDISYDTLMGLEAKDHHQLAEKATWLPKNLRALLLLVDAWSRAPWQEITTATNFWGPITLARISASFFLSGMAYYVWQDHHIAEGLTGHARNLFFPVGNFHELRNLGPDPIEAAYSQLLVHLRSLLDRDVDLIGNHTPDSHPLEYQARTSLKEALGECLKLPFFQLLRCDEATLNKNLNAMEAKASKTAPGT